MPKTLPVVDMSARVCCAPAAAGPVDDAAALEVALRLKAMADPARVKLMSLLLTSAVGSETTGGLAAVVGLSESTVSHHLGQLRTAGLVASQRRGMNVYHRGRRDAPGALCLVLDATAAADRRERLPLARGGSDSARLRPSARSVVYRRGTGVLRCPSTAEASMR